MQQAMSWHTKVILFQNTGIAPVLTSTKADEAIALSTKRTIVQRAFTVINSIPIIGETLETAFPQLPLLAGLDREQIRYISAKHSTPSAIAVYVGLTFKNVTQGLESAIQALANKMPKAIKGAAFCLRVQGLHLKCALWRSQIIGTDTLYKTINKFSFDDVKMMGWTDLNEFQEKVPWMKFKDTVSQKLIVWHKAYIATNILSILATVPLATLYYGKFSEFVCAAIFIPVSLTYFIDSIIYTNTIITSMKMYQDDTPSMNVDKDKRVMDGVIHYAFGKCPWRSAIDEMWSADHYGKNTHKYIIEGYTMGKRNLENIGIVTEGNKYLLLKEVLRDEAALRVISHTEKVGVLTSEQQAIIAATAGVSYNKISEEITFAPGVSEEELRLLQNNSLLWEIKKEKVTIDQAETLELINEMPGLAYDAVTHELIMGPGFSIDLFEEIRRNKEKEKRIKPIVPVILTLIDNCQKLRTAMLHYRDKCDTFLTTLALSEKNDSAVEVISKVVRSYPVQQNTREAQSIEAFLALFTQRNEWREGRKLTDAVLRRTAFRVAFYEIRQEIITLLKDVKDQDLHDFILEELSEGRMDMIAEQFIVRENKKTPAQFIREYLVNAVQHRYAAREGRRYISDHEFPVWKAQLKSISDNCTFSYADGVLSLEYGLETKTKDIEQYLKDSPIGTIAHPYKMFVQDVYEKFGAEKVAKLEELFEESGKGVVDIETVAAVLQPFAQEDLEKYFTTTESLFVVNPFCTEDSVLYSDVFNSLSQDKKEILLLLLQDSRSTADKLEDIKDKLHKAVSPERREELRVRFEENMHVGIPKDIVQELVGDSWEEFFIPAKTFVKTKSQFLSKRSMHILLSEGNVAAFEKLSNKKKVIQKELFQAFIDTMSQRANVHLHDIDTAVINLEKFFKDQEKNPQVASVRSAKIIKTVLERIKSLALSTDLILLNSGLELYEHFHDMLTRNDDLYGAGLTEDEFVTFVSYLYEGVVDTKACIQQLGAPIQEWPQEILDVFERPVVQRRAIAQYFSDDIDKWPQAIARLFYVTYSKDELRWKDEVNDTFFKDVELELQRLVNVGHMEASAAQQLRTLLSNQYALSEQATQLLFKKDAEHRISSLKNKKQRTELLELWSQSLVRGKSEQLDDMQKTLLTYWLHDAGKGKDNYDPLIVPMDDARRMAQDIVAKLKGLARTNFIADSTEQLIYGEDALNEDETQRTLLKNALYEEFNISASSADAVIATLQENGAAYIRRARAVGNYWEKDNVATILEEARKQVNRGCLSLSNKEQSAVNALEHFSYQLDGSSGYIVVQKEITETEVNALLARVAEAQEIQTLKPLVASMKKLQMQYHEACEKAATELLAWRKSLSFQLELSEQQQQLLSSLHYFSYDKKEKMINLNKDISPFELAEIEKLISNSSVGKGTEAFKFFQTKLLSLKELVIKDWGKNRAIREQEKKWRRLFVEPGKFGKKELAALARIEGFTYDPVRYELVLTKSLSVEEYNDLEKRILEAQQLVHLAPALNSIKKLSKQYVSHNEDLKQLIRKAIAMLESDPQALPSMFTAAVLELLGVEESYNNTYKAAQLKKWLNHGTSVASKVQLEELMFLIENEDAIEKSSPEGFDSNLSAFVVVLWERFATEAKKYMAHPNKYKEPQVPQLLKHFMDVYGLNKSVSKYRIENILGEKKNLSAKFVEKKNGITCLVSSYQDVISSLPVSAPVKDNLLEYCSQPVLQRFFNDLTSTPAMLDEIYSNIQKVNQTAFFARPSLSYVLEILDEYWELARVSHVCFPMPDAVIEFLKRAGISWDDEKIDYSFFERSSIKSAVKRYYETLERDPFVRKTNFASSLRMLFYEKGGLKDNYVATVMGEKVARALAERMMTSEEIIKEIQTRFSNKSEEQAKYLVWKEWQDRVVNGTKDQKGLIDIIREELLKIEKSKHSLQLIKNADRIEFLARAMAEETMDHFMEGRQQHVYEAEAFLQRIATSAHQNNLLLQSFIDDKGSLFRGEWNHQQYARTVQDVKNTKKELDALMSENVFSKMVEAVVKHGMMKEGRFHGSLHSYRELEHVAVDVILNGKDLVYEVPYQLDNEKSIKRAVIITREKILEQTGINPYIYDLVDPQVRLEQLQKMLIKAEKDLKRENSLYKHKVERLKEEIYIDKTDKDSERYAKALEKFQETLHTFEDSVADIYGAIAIAQKKIESKTGVAPEAIKLSKEAETALVASTERAEKTAVRNKLEDGVKEKQFEIFEKTVSKDKALNAVEEKAKKDIKHVPSARRKEIAAAIREYAASLGKEKLQRVYLGILLQKYVVDHIPGEFNAEMLTPTVNDILAYFSSHGEEIDLKAFVSELKKDKYKKPYICMNKIWTGFRGPIDTALQGITKDIVSDIDRGVLRRASVDLGDMTEEDAQIVQRVQDVFVSMFYLEMRIPGVTYHGSKGSETDANIFNAEIARQMGTITRQLLIRDWATEQLGEGRVHAPNYVAYRIKKQFKHIFLKDDTRPKVHSRELKKERGMEYNVAYRAILKGISSGKDSQQVVEELWKQYSIKEYEVVEGRLNHIKEELLDIASDMAIRLYSGKAFSVFMMLREMREMKRDPKRPAIEIDHPDHQKAYDDAKALFDAYERGEFPETIGIRVEELSAVLDMAATDAKFKKIVANKKLFSSNKKGVLHIAVTIEELQRGLIKQIAASELELSVEQQQALQNYCEGVIAGQGEINLQAAIVRYVEQQIHSDAWGHLSLREKNEILKEMLYVHYMDIHDKKLIRNVQEKTEYEKLLPEYLMLTHYMKNERGENFWTKGPPHVAVALERSRMARERVVNFLPTIKTQFGDIGKKMRTEYIIDRPRTGLEVAVTLNSYIGAQLKRQYAPQYQVELGEEWEYGKYFERVGREIDKRSGQLQAIIDQTYVQKDKEVMWDIVDSVAGVLREGIWKQISEFDENAALRSCIADKNENDAQWKLFSDLEKEEIIASVQNDAADSDEALFADIENLVVHLAQGASSLAVSSGYSFESKALYDLIKKEVAAGKTTVEIAEELVSKIDFAEKQEKNSASITKVVPAIETTGNRMAHYFTEAFRTVRSAVKDTEVSNSILALDRFEKHMKNWTLAIDLLQSAELQVESRANIHRLRTDAPADQAYAMQKEMRDRFEKNETVLTAAIIFHDMYKMFNDVGHTRGSYDLFVRMAKNNFAFFEGTDLYKNVLVKLLKNPRDIEMVGLLILYHDTGSVNMDGNFGALEKMRKVLVAKKIDLDTFFEDLSLFVALDRAAVPNTKNDGYLTTYDYLTYKNILDRMKLGDKYISSIDDIVAYIARQLVMNCVDKGENFNFVFSRIKTMLNKMFEPEQLKRLAHKLNTAVKKVDTINYLNEYYFYYGLFGNKVPQDHDHKAIMQQMASGEFDDAFLEKYVLIKLSTPLMFNKGEVEAINSLAPISIVDSEQRDVFLPSPDALKEDILRIVQGETVSVSVVKKQKKGPSDEQIVTKLLEQVDFSKPVSQKPFFADQQQKDFSAAESIGLQCYACFEELLSYIDAHTMNIKKAAHSEYARLKQHMRTGWAENINLLANLKENPKVFEKLFRIYADAPEEKRRAVARELNNIKNKFNEEFTVFMAAIVFHDIGKAIGSEDHEERSLGIFQQLAKDGFSELKHTLLYENFLSQLSKRDIAKVELLIKYHGIGGVTVDGNYGLLQQLKNDDINGVYKKYNFSLEEIMASLNVMVTLDRASVHNSFPIQPEEIPVELSDEQKALLFSSQQGDMLLPVSLEELNKVAIDGKITYQQAQALSPLFRQVHQKNTAGVLSYYDYQNFQKVVTAIQTGAEPFSSVEDVATFIAQQTVMMSQNKQKSFDEVFSRVLKSVKKLVPKEKDQAIIVKKMNEQVKLIRTTSYMNSYYFYFGQYDNASLSDENFKKVYDIAAAGDYSEKFISDEFIDRFVMAKVMTTLLFSKEKTAIEAMPFPVPVGNNTQNVFRLSYAGMKEQIHAVLAGETVPQFLEDQKELKRGKHIAAEMETWKKFKGAVGNSSEELLKKKIQAIASRFAMKKYVADIRSLQKGLQQLQEAQLTQSSVPQDIHASVKELYYEYLNKDKFVKTEYAFSLQYFSEQTKNIFENVRGLAVDRKKQKLVADNRFTQKVAEDVLEKLNKIDDIAEIKKATALVMNLLRSANHINSFGDYLNTNKYPKANAERMRLGLIVNKDRDNKTYDTFYDSAGFADYNVHLGHIENSLDMIYQNVQASEYSEGWEFKQDTYGRFLLPRGVYPVGCYNQQNYLTYLTLIEHTTYVETQQPEYFWWPLQFLAEKFSSAKLEKVSVDAEGNAIEKYRESIITGLPRRFFNFRQLNGKKFSSDSSVQPDLYDHLLKNNIYLYKLGRAGLKIGALIASWAMLGPAGAAFAFPLMRWVTKATGRQLYYEMGMDTAFQSDFVHRDQVLLAFNTDESWEKYFEDYNAEDLVFKKDARELIEASNMLPENKKIILSFFDSGAKIKRDEFLLLFNKDNSWQQYFEDPSVEKLVFKDGAAELLKNADMPEEKKEALLSFHQQYAQNKDIRSEFRKWEALKLIGSVATAHVMAAAALINPLLALPVLGASKLIGWGISMRYEQETDPFFFRAYHHFKAGKFAEGGSFWKSIEMRPMAHLNVKGSLEDSSLKPKQNRKSLDGIFLKEKQGANPMQTSDKTIKDIVTGRWISSKIRELQEWSTFFMHGRQYKTLSEWSVTANMLTYSRSPWLAMAMRIIMPAYLFMNVQAIRTIPSAVKIAGLTHMEVFMIVNMINYLLMRNIGLKRGRFMGRTLYEAEHDFTYEFMHTFALGMNTWVKDESEWGGGQGIDPFNSEPAPLGLVRSDDPDAYNKILDRLPMLNMVMGSDIHMREYGYVRTSLTSNVIEALYIAGLMGSAGLFNGAMMAFLGYWIYWNWKSGQNAIKKLGEGASQYGFYSPDHWWAQFKKKKAFIRKAHLMKIGLAVLALNATVGSYVRKNYINQPLMPAGIRKAVEQKRYEWAFQYLAEKIVLKADEVTAEKTVIPSEAKVRDQELQKLLNAAQTDEDYQKLKDVLAFDIHGNLLKGNLITGSEGIFIVNPSHRGKQVYKDDLRSSHIRPDYWRDYKQVGVVTTEQQVYLLGIALQRGDVAFAKGILRGIFYMLGQEGAYGMPAWRASFVRNINTGVVELIIDKKEAAADADKYMINYLIDIVQHKLLSDFVITEQDAKHLPSGLAAKIDKIQKGLHSMVDGKTKGTRVLQEMMYHFIDLFYAHSLGSENGKFWITLLSEDVVGRNAIGEYELEPAYFLTHISRKLAAIDGDRRKVWLAERMHAVAMIEAIYADCGNIIPDRVIVKYDIEKGKMVYRPAENKAKDLQGKKIVSKTDIEQYAPQFVPYAKQLFDNSKVETLHFADGMTLEKAISRINEIADKLKKEVNKNKRSHIEAERLEMVRLVRRAFKKEVFTESWSSLRVYWELAADLLKYDDAAAGSEIPESFRVSQRIRKFLLKALQDRDIDAEYSTEKLTDLARVYHYLQASKRTKGEEPLLIAQVQTNARAILEIAKTDILHPQKIFVSKNVKDAYYLQSEAAEKLLSKVDSEEPFITKSFLNSVWLNVFAAIGKVDLAKKALKLCDGPVQYTIVDGVHRKQEINYYPSVIQMRTIDLLMQWNKIHAFDENKVIPHVWNHETINPAVKAKKMRSGDFKKLMGYSLRTLYREGVATDGAVNDTMLLDVYRNALMLAEKMNSEGYTDEAVKILTAVKDTDLKVLRDYTDLSYAHYTVFDSLTGNLKNAAGMQKLAAAILELHYQKGFKIFGNIITNPFDMKNSGAAKDIRDFSAMGSRRLQDSARLINAYNNFGAWSFIKKEAVSVLKEASYPQDEEKLSSLNFISKTIGILEDSLTKLGEYYDSKEIFEELLEDVRHKDNIPLRMAYLRALLKLKERGDEDTLKGFRELMFVRQFIVESKNAQKLSNRTHHFYRHKYFVGLDDYFPEGQELTMWGAHLSEVFASLNMSAAQKLLGDIFSKRIVTKKDLEQHLAADVIQSDFSRFLMKLRLETTKEFSEAKIKELEATFFDLHAFVINGGVDEKMQMAFQIIKSQGVVDAIGMQLNLNVQGYHQEEAAQYYKILFMRFYQRAYQDTSSEAAHFRTNLEAFNMQQSKWRQQESIAFQNLDKMQEDRLKAILKKDGLVEAKESASISKENFEILLKDPRAVELFYLYKETIGAIKEQKDVIEKEIAEYKKVALRTRQEIHLLKHKQFVVSLEVLSELYGRKIEILSRIANIAKVACSDNEMTYSNVRTRMRNEYSFIVGMNKNILAVWYGDYDHKWRVLKNTAGTLIDSGLQLFNSAIADPNESHYRFIGKIQKDIPSLKSISADRFKVVEAEEITSLRQVAYVIQKKASGEIIVSRSIKGVAHEIQSTNTLEELSEYLYKKGFDVERVNSILMQCTEGAGFSIVQGQVEYKVVKNGDSSYAIAVRSQPDAAFNDVVIGIKNIEALKKNLIVQGFSEERAQHFIEALKNDALTSEQKAFISAVGNHVYNLSFHWIRSKVSYMERVNLGLRLRSTLLKLETELLPQMPYQLAQYRRSVLIGPVSYSVTPDEISTASNVLTIAGNWSDAMIENLMQRGDENSANKALLLALITSGYANEHIHIDVAGGKNEGYFTWKYKGKKIVRSLRFQDVDEKAFYLNLNQVSFSAEEVARQRTAIYDVLRCYPLVRIANTQRLARVLSEVVCHRSNFYRSNRDLAQNMDALLREVISDLEVMDPLNEDIRGIKAQYNRLKINAETEIALRTFDNVLDLRRQEAAEYGTGYCWALTNSVLVGLSHLERDFDPDNLDIIKRQLDVFVKRYAELQEKMKNQKSDSLGLLYTFTTIKLYYLQARYYSLTAQRAYGTVLANKASYYIDLLQGGQLNSTVVDDGLSKWIMQFRPQVYALAASQKLRYVAIIAGIESMKNTLRNDYYQQIFTGVLPENVKAIIAEMDNTNPYVRGAFINGLKKMKDISAVHSEDVTLTEVKNAYYQRSEIIATVLSLLQNENIGIFTQKDITLVETLIMANISQQSIFPEKDRLQNYAHSIYQWMLLQYYADVLNYRKSSLWAYFDAYLRGGNLKNFTVVENAYLRIDSLVKKNVYLQKMFLVASCQEAKYSLRKTLSSDKFAEAIETIVLGPKVQELLIKWKYEGGEMEKIEKVQRLMIELVQHKTFKHMTGNMFNRASIEVFINDEEVPVYIRQMLSGLKQDI